MFHAKKLGKVVLKNGETIEIQISKYTNNRVAIFGICEDGERWDVLSRNIPDLELGEGEFFVPADEDKESWTELCRNSGLFKTTNKKINFNEELFEIWKIIGIF